MKVVKCKNGHFYDADKYDACPHCGQASAKEKESESKPLEKSYRNAETTVGIFDDTEKKSSESRESGNTGNRIQAPKKELKSKGETIGVFDDDVNEPKEFTAFSDNSINNTSNTQDTDWVASSEKSEKVTIIKEKNKKSNHKLLNIALIVLGSLVIIGVVIAIVSQEFSKNYEVSLTITKQEELDIIENTDERNKYIDNKIVVKNCLVWKTANRYGFAIDTKDELISCCYSMCKSDVDISSVLGKRCDLVVTYSIVNGFLIEGYYNVRPDPVISNYEEARDFGDFDAWSNVHREIEFSNGVVSFVNKSITFGEPEASGGYSYSFYIKDQNDINIESLKSTLSGKAIVERIKDPIGTGNQYVIALDILSIDNAQKSN